MLSVWWVIQGIFHYELLENESREDHSKGLDSENLEASVTENSATTSRKLCEKLNISLTRALRELKRIGMVSGWQMGPARPVSRESPTTCLMLLAIAYTRTSKTHFGQVCNWR